MFMTMEYTVDSCYRVYQSERLEKCEEPVSQDKFRRVRLKNQRVTHVVNVILLMY